LPGVAAVDVSLEAGQATITHDGQQSSVAQFTTVIENAGFDVL
jgi:copper chaperone CopZ